MLKQVEIFTDGSCLEIQAPAATVRFYAIAGKKKLLAKALTLRRTTAWR